MQHGDESSQEAWLIVDEIIGKLFYSDMKLALL